MNFTEARAKARSEAALTLEEYWDETLPVDPIAIAKGMGISCFQAQLGTNVSGMIQKEPNQPAEILVDVDDGPLRSRFTIAHELGHFVHHMWGHDEVAARFVDRRDGKSDIHEFHANEFAGSLLMPERAFRHFATQGWSDWEIAKKFHVSTAAVRVRKQTLGI
jgi:Zn-dependent peptidase ImmA (M78 family)